MEIHPWSISRYSLWHEDKYFRRTIDRHLPCCECELPCTDRSEIMVTIAQTIRRNWTPNMCEQNTNSEKFKKTGIACRNSKHNLMRADNFHRNMLKRCAKWRTDNCILCGPNGESNIFCSDWGAVTPHTVLCESDSVGGTLVVYRNVFRKVIREISFGINLHHPCINKRREILIKLRGCKHWVYKPRYADKTFSKSITMKWLFHKKTITYLHHCKKKRNHKRTKRTRKEQSVTRLQMVKICKETIHGRIGKQVKTRIFFYKEREYE